MQKYEPWVRDLPIGRGAETLSAPSVARQQDFGRFEAFNYMRAQAPDDDTGPVDCFGGRLRHRGQPRAGGLGAAGAAS